MPKTVKMPQFDEIDEDMDESRYIEEEFGIVINDWKESKNYE